MVLDIVEDIDTVVAALVALEVDLIAVDLELVQHLVAVQLDKQVQDFDPMTGMVIVLEMY